MRTDLLRVIHPLCVRQHGVVTRCQLIAAGVTRAQVEGVLNSGFLRPVVRGVYEVEGARTPLSRVMAAAIIGGEQAVVSHVTAGRLWKLLPPSGSRAAAGSGPRALIGKREAIHVTIPPGRTRTSKGITWHRVCPPEPDELGEYSGIPVTAPARTILDLAAVLGSRDLERALARAWRNDLLDASSLEDLVERNTGRWGVRGLRAIVDQPNGPRLTRSEAEDRLLELVRDGCLPDPETNVVVGPYELDFLWRNSSLVVEVDGYAYHGSSAQFERDRRKDAWLQGEGFRVIRLSWSQIVEESTATAVLLGQALLRARRGVAG